MTIDFDYLKKFIELSIEDYEKEKTDFRLGFARGMIEASLVSGCISIWDEKMYSDKVSIIEGREISPYFD